MAALALTYRPKQFSSVLGQPHITAVLQAMVREGEISPSYLFAGPHGTGKSSAARIFAAALNCQQASDGDPCGQCDLCAEISQGRSPLVLEVDAASAGGVADVEHIREICLHVPTSRWRCVILDEAQSMSREAYNALLKMLEEPPERTAFVIVTTEPDKILKTVRSRSLPFHFRPVAPVSVAQFLWDISQQEEFEVEPQLCMEIAMRTGGHVRDAVMALDLCRSAGVTTRQGYVESFAVPDASLPVLTALAEGSLPKALQAAETFLSQCADTALFISHLTDTLTHVLAAAAGGDAADPVRRLASVWDRAKLFEAMRLVWDFSDRYKMHADPRTQVRLVVSRLAVAFDVEFAQTMSTIDAETALRESGLMMS